MARTTTERERELGHDLDYAEDDRGAYGAPPRRDGGGWVALAVIVGLVALGLGLWALLADDDTAAGPEIGVTVSDVVEDPARYVGQMLALNGEVAEFVGGEFPLAGGAGAFRLDGDVLVIAPNAEGMTADPLNTGDIVRVFGTVRTFVTADFQNEFGVTFDDSAFVELEREVALVAETIRIIEPANPSETPGNVVAQEIIDDPEAYFGEEVQIESIVTDVNSANAFEVEEGELLVVNETFGDLDVGNIVDVNGVVREFDEIAIEEETGFLLEDGLFDDWDGRPVIVADEVSGVAGG